MLFVGRQITDAETSTSQNILGIKATEEYYKQIWNECEDFVLHNVDVTTFEQVISFLKP